MKYFILTLFLSAAAFAYGQNDDININYHRVPNAATDSSRVKKVKDNDYLERISIGGTLGAQISTYSFFELSPDAAYHFSDWGCVGIGGTYLLFYDNPKKKAYHVGGARVFAEGHFLQFLGVHLTYQALNYDSFFATSLKTNRIWSNNLSMGGGYYQRANRTAVYFYILYNISDRPVENIYGRLLFKTGFRIFLK